ncbi:cell division protein FtsL [Bradymonas sediminis]|nr:cell division protein FtsL [Bradymonas sediminis]
MLKESAADGLRILRVVALVAIPVAMLFFHVWTRYQITDLGYEVAEQTRTHRQLIEEKRKLSIEAAYQGRNDRVLALAREKFGLEELQPSQVIQVEQFAHSDAKQDQDAPQKHAALELSRR